MSLSYARGIVINRNSFGFLFVLWHLGRNSVVYRQKMQKKAGLFGGVG